MRYIQWRDTMTNQQGWTSKYTLALLTEAEQRSATGGRGQLPRVLPPKCIGYNANTYCLNPWAGS